MQYLSNRTALAQLHLLCHRTLVLRSTTQNFSEMRVSIRRVLFYSRISVGGNSDRSNSQEVRRLVMRELDDELPLPAAKSDIALQDDGGHARCSACQSAGKRKGILNVDLGPMFRISSLKQTHRLHHQ